MNAMAKYLASCVGIIAVVGAIAWAVKPGNGEAIALSAGLALVVQLLAFSIARLAQPKNMMVGWGLGSALRLLAVVLYGVVVAKLWRASMAPALLSFVAFLFLTMVVEPVFLKR